MILISFICCIIITGSIYFSFIGTHAAHVSFLFTPFFYICGSLLHGNVCMAKEIDDVFIYTTVHLFEQHVGFAFIYYQWIFLLIMCSLYTLLQIIHSTQMFFP